MLFLNMLRVFKYQSPMSVGAWILVSVRRVRGPGVAARLNSTPMSFRRLRSTRSCSSSRACSALAQPSSGLGLATYTGVLIGATAIPAWFLHRVSLPIHFGTAGLGSAAAILELLGFQIRPLLRARDGGRDHRNAALDLARVRQARRGRSCPASKGSTGWLIRGGAVLCGPLPIVLRLTNFVSLAAISFLFGALLSRFGWIAAGRVSGRDPEAVFASQE